MASWYVGQKVVCIKRGRWVCQEFLDQFPVYGQVLTIRSVRLCDECGVIGLRFAEVLNSEMLRADGTRDEPDFAAYRFRPVIARKTDIGFAHEILRRAQRELVDAEGGAA